MAATGEAEGKSAGSASTLDFEAASSGLAYTSDTATSEAGKVTVNFHQPAAIGRHVSRSKTPAAQPIGKTEVATEGSDSTRLVNLKSGEYTFYCTVPGPQGSRAWKAR